MAPIVRHPMILITGGSSLHDMSLLLCVSIVTITLSSVLGVLAPLQLQQRGLWSETVIDVLIYFTGGVFLGAGMVHMLPEAVQEVSGLGLPQLCDPFVMFCLGYLVIFAVEQTQSGRPFSHHVKERSQLDVPPAMAYLDGLKELRQTLLTPEQSQELDALEQFAHAHTSSSTAPRHVPPSAMEHAHAHSSAGLQQVRLLLGRPYRSDVGSDIACASGCHDHDHVPSGVRLTSAVEGHGATTMPLLLAVLFSVHSFIAGLALGVQSKFGSSALAILIAILGHKFVEALALASCFVKEGLGPTTALPALAVYCTMTPAGVLVGAFLVGADLGPTATAIEALVSGFGAGSFVYLGGHQLVLSRPESVVSKQQRALLALAGFSSMALLSLYI
jgi:zinc transporter 1/2/3